MVLLSGDEIQNYLQGIADASSNDECRPKDGKISENDDNVSVHLEEEDFISKCEKSYDEDVSLSCVLSGKDGHVWSSVPPASSRTSRRN
ncbi:unnamed protein product [Euphydryas editha]|uniref:Uncharacterized protein n=1 Tax=Euphydryas editha TaxID=104508 RepID=A0AAU9TYH3_EUPED|nr:unnamed protein product [Euphydryas editha]